MAKPATIYDISRILNLSPSTVSRALNNNDRVSAATRARVLDVSRSLGYTPNRGALYLKTQRCGQIMLSIPHIEDAFYVNLISAVQAVVRQHDYALMLNYTGGIERDELRVLENANRNFIDGLIFVSLNISPRHNTLLAGIDHPVVLSSISSNRLRAEDSHCDFVGVDTQKGIYLAVRHLLGQGHMRIGFIGYDLGTQTGEERFQGYRTALNESGIEVRPGYVFTGEYNLSLGMDAGRHFAALDPRPTAICASADLIVLGLYRVFEEVGLRVPQDISVTGMDNIGTTTLVKPKISTVAISQAEIGRYAAELIFRRLDGYDGPPESMVFQPRLVVRDSSIALE